MLTLRFGILNEPIYIQDRGEIMINQGKRIDALSVSILIAAVLSSTGLKAQANWTHVTDQPVLSYGAAGEWDDGVVFWAAVIGDGDTLRMWYAGSDDVLGPGTVQIGYAWSFHGISWHRYAGNPVLAAELSWELGTVVSPAVIKDEDTFKMWYGAASVPPSIIGYATSADGMKWDRHSDPVLQPGPAGDWDSSIMGPGTVTKENNEYKMWYWGGRGSWPGSLIQIGLAISSDGINWVKYDDASTSEAPFSNSDPVLKVGSLGKWDELRVWTPAVLATTAGYEMWYAGREGPFTPPQLVGYATSMDGIEWKKSQDNPVIGTAPIWGLSYLTSSVLKFDGFYHLWYTSFTFTAQGNQRAEIGYATSPVLASSGSELEIPDGYLLSQNHPNPFNGTTRLRYDLPERTDVVLVIYDILGRHIKTLVRGVEEAGFKSVAWNGTDQLGKPVSTGVYLYQIHAGDFTQTRKMLLLK